MESTSQTTSFFLLKRSLKICVLSRKTGHSFTKLAGKVVSGNKTCTHVHPMVKQRLFFSDDGGIIQHLMWGKSTHMHRYHTWVINTL